MCRRPPTGLYGGLWELPSTPPLAPEAGLNPHDVLARVWADSFGLKVSVGRQLGQVKHVLTHMRLTVGVHGITAADHPHAPLQGYTALKWVHPARAEQVALSSLAVKTLKLISSTH